MLYSFFYVFLDEFFEVCQGHSLVLLVSAEIIENSLQRDLAPKDDALDLLQHIGNYRWN